VFLVLNLTEVMLQQRQRSQVRQNETELSSVNMTSIHCKLQEEAEKIRKWQTSSDIELKQKITKLKECEQLISKQRNQVLEMQIENESLLTKLQKEQFNQAQINVKLKTSRELFIALKNHSENLQTSIIRGEEDRDSLRMLAAENIKQIKDLKSTIQDMTDVNDKQLITLKSCMKDREIAHEEFKFKSEQDIENALKCSEALEVELKKYKNNVDDLSRQLIEKQGIVSSREEKIVSLEEHLKDQQIMNESNLSDLSEIQITLNQTELSYKSAQSEILRVQKENLDLNDKFRAYKIESESQIESFQDNQARLNDSLTNLSTQFNEISSKHDRLEDENKSLKESVSQLVKCIEELQEKQEENEQEIIQLNDMYKASVEREAVMKDIVQQKDDQFENLKSDKEQVESQLNTISKDMKLLKAQEEKGLQQIEQLESSNNEYKKNLEETMQKSLEKDATSNNLLLELERKTTEYIQCETKSNQCEENLNALSLSLNEKEHEIKKLTSTNCILKLKVEEYTSKHQGLESILGDLNQHLTTLQDEYNTCCLQFESMRTQSLDKEKEIYQKDAEFLKMKKENETCKKEIKTLTTATRSLEKTLSNVKNLNEKANAVAMEKSLECDSLKVVNLDLERRNCKLKSDLSSAEDGSSDLSKRLSTELQDAIMEVSDKSDTIKKLQETLLKLKDDQSRSINDMKAENEALNLDNKQLTLSISQKVEDISALAEEINKLQNKILKLEESNISLKKDYSNQLNCLKAETITLEKCKVDLTQYSSECEKEKLSMVSELNSVKEDKLEIEKYNNTLKSNNNLLLSENMQHKEEIEKLMVQINDIQTQNISFNDVNHKLEEKSKQVILLQESFDKIQSDFLLSENKYMSTIEKLRGEIKKLNKNKVKAVLSNVASKSPSVSKESSNASFVSPKHDVVNNPESPKTPSCGRSKKRRVAFGKSPSWHSASDDNLDEEEDTTVSSSTGSSLNKTRNIALSKSPKLATYSSTKSPRLKFGKSPAPVNELLANYPAPSSSEKRGMKLPDAYVKRKEESLKKKQKIKVETCSWFDTESAFGFDEK